MKPDKVARELLLAQYCAAGLNTDACIVAKFEPQFLNAGPT